MLQVGAYICENIQNVVNILQEYSATKRADAIFGVYMCPASIIKLPNESLQYEGQNTPYYLSQEINKPSSLNGYIPKNNKMLTFPYCFLNVSNNNGITNTYNYELFNSLDEYPNKCIFNIKGVPTIGGSIKCNPVNYKMTNEADNEEEGIMAGKFPTLSWSEDAYINWLTQNSVNIGIGLASDVLSTIGGLGLLATGVGVAGRFFCSIRNAWNCKYFI